MGDGAWAKSRRNERSKSPSSEVKPCLRSLTQHSHYCSLWKSHRYTCTLHVGNTVLIAEISALE